MKEHRLLFQYKKRQAWIKQNHLIETTELKWIMKAELKTEQHTKAGSVPKNGILFLWQTI